MAGLYDGKPTAISQPPTIAITSSSNSNPITITTSTPLPAEFFLTDFAGNPALPVVHISNHLVNTQANGIFVATPTGASTFTIPVAGTGVGIASGAVQPLYLQSAYNVPQDGDSDTSASIASWAQATGDRTQWLATRTGQFKLARREIFQHTNIGTTPWAHWPGGGVTAGVPVQLVGDGGAWGTAIGSAVASPTGGPGNVVFAIDGVVTGDYVNVRLVTTLAIDVTNMLALYSSIAPFSAFIPAWPADYGQVAGASAIGPAVSGSAVPVPISCEGVATNSAPHSGTLWVQPVLYPLANGSPVLNLNGDALLYIDIWRSTGMAQ